MVDAADGFSPFVAVCGRLAIKLAAPNIEEMRVIAAFCKMGCKATTIEEQDQRDYKTRI
jgi:hypothetical protein